MYQDRIVLFIDVLGWKNLVEKSSFDDVNKVYEEFSRMIKVMNEQLNSNFFYTRKAANLETRKVLKFKENEQDIIFFSDCIVWSYPTSELAGINFPLILLHLCGAFDVILSVLFNKGISIRGGLTIGPLYQKGNKVFGQGLVTAYELEQKAIYPRIAIDSKMIFDRLKSPSEYEFIKLFMSYNPRGNFFVHDYFKKIQSFIKRQQNPKFELDSEMEMLLLKTFIDPVIHVIEMGLQSPSSHVRTKYEWLRAKLLAIEGLPYNLASIR